MSEKRVIWRYDPRSHPQIITDLRIKGKTIPMIAKKMGIAPGTLYSWARKYPAVKSAIETGREILTETLERNLYKQAQGYDYREVVMHYDADGNLTGKTIYIKHQAGHAGAAIFALKNLNPQKWRDVHRIESEITFKVGLPPKEMWLIEDDTGGNGNNQS